MKISTYLTIAILTIVLATAAHGQSHTFTYQGKLTDSSLPANGTYDFQFILLTGSPLTQVGPTLLRPGTAVTSGIFTVQLDFSTGPGNPFLTGADMVLQIGVKKPADVAFTVLTPNQPVTSEPYAIRSEAAGSADLALDSQKLGGLAAAQYVLTGDARLSDSRTPLPGSPNYIQNGVGLQAASNFNISGTGTANSFNSGSAYNILNNRALSADAGGNTFVGFNITFANTGSNNTFVGNLAGHANTSGFSNSFFGQNTGGSNSGGVQNSFFGANAGSTNTSGNGNSFFGESSGANNNASGNAFFGNGSGFSNTSGSQNSFFGFQAGNSNTTNVNNSFFGFRAGLGSTGGNNSFFGSGAGASNTGDNNSFFGNGAGASNSTGHDNDFYGNGAGASNTTGVFNTFFGSGAGAANTTTSNNTFFGANAGNKNTGGSSNAFFGNGSGFNNTTGLANAFFGVNAGIANTTGGANTFIGQNTGANITTGANNTFVGAGAGNVFGITGGEGGNTMIGEATGFLTGVTNSTAIGVGATATSSNTINLGRTSENTIVWGKLLLNSLGTAGGSALCLNGSNLVAFCSSSLRYKKDLSPFTGGLAVANRLHPVTFTWKDTGKRDLGLGAEEVAKVDPLLVTYNQSGEVEGVKYDRISVILLNAIKEQQAQIDRQAAEIRRQQESIEAMRKALCSRRKTLEICKTSR